MKIDNLFMKIEVLAAFVMGGIGTLFPIGICLYLDACSHYQMMEKIPHVLIKLLALPIMGISGMLFALPTYFLFELGKRFFHIPMFPPRFPNEVGDGASRKEENLLK